MSCRPQRGRYRMTINGKLDPRFSEAEQAADWQTVSDALAAAELYWLTTVRGDGRPHITPLVGAWVDDGSCSAPGREEQKARNLDALHRGRRHDRRQHVEGRARRGRRGHRRSGSPAANR